jgi:hypothetical protein
MTIVPRYSNSKFLLKEIRRSWNEYKTNEDISVDDFLDFCKSNLQEVENFKSMYRQLKKNCSDSKEWNFLEKISDEEISSLYWTKNQYQRFMSTFVRESNHQNLK